MISPKKFKLQALCGITEPRTNPERNAKQRGKLHPTFIKSLKKNLKKAKLYTTVILLHCDTTRAATQDKEFRYVSLDGENNNNFTSFVLQIGRPSTISRVEFAQ